MYSGWRRWYLRLRSQKREAVSRERDRKEEEEPEEEDTSCSTDLIVRQNIPKLLRDVADAFDDGVEALTWVDNNRVSRGWVYHWWLSLFSFVCR